MSNKAVADLKPGELDEMDIPILAMYARKAPDYAVYRTSERVVLQYADDRVLAAEQRKTISALLPLRGEINGLINGWRAPDASRDRQRKAQRYDRRVADGFILALEGDPAGAASVLSGVKKDIYDERIAVSRFQYLGSALGLVLLVVLVAILAVDVVGTTEPDLWRAAAAGAVGAFFSIAIALHSRTVLTDLQYWSNMMDAFLRVTIGTIAGVVLMALVGAHAVTLGIGSATLGTAGSLYVFIVGFVAGFSERLVQDLLAKVEVTPNGTKPQPAPPPPAPAPATPAAAPAAPGTPAAAAAAAAAAGNDDPAIHDHDADVDHCLSEVPVAPEEITPDTELPPASGGVAKS